MSQQTNAGFNAPGFSVVADDPCVIAPGAAAATAAKSGPWLRAASLIAPSVDLTPLSASDAVAVCHIASFASADSFGSPRLLYFPRSRFTASSATGVCHIAATACARIATNPAELPASLLPPFAGARLVGVAHIAAATCRGSWSILLRPSGLSVAMPGESFQSRALAVIQSPASARGDKPDAITSMRRIDGASRDNDRPPGVCDAFQVSKHSVDPTVPSRCRNLLSHDDSGPSGTDEAKHVGP